VDAVLARTGALKVDLVVHGMGGLSSRLYILQLAGPVKTRAPCRSACAEPLLGNA
jgi:triacylglycerol esterase/lipase EstA (alpha/beta hydrolase family)